MSDFNLKNVQDSNEIKKIAERDIGDRKVRLMLTGYSAAPDGYAEKTQAFVNALVQKAGAKNVALITSPTADEGSIDAIGTMVAQGTGAKVMYITCQDYVGYIDPSKFPAGLDTSIYTAKEKYVLPTKDKYCVASAVAANAILVTGGRDTAVQDTVNSLLQHNRVIVVENLTNSSAWDVDKNRVNNAAAYIREQLQSLETTGKLKYEERGGLTKDFLTKHKNDFVFVTKPEDAVRALTAQQTSAPHVKRTTKSNPGHRM